MLFETAVNRDIDPRLMCSSVGGSCTYCHSLCSNAHHFHLGIRISLYNAITEEHTDQLVAYIDEFLLVEAGTKA